MPEMDGFEATAVLRRDERTKDVPIVAMTAHAMVLDRERCLEAGMNDHIPKPIDPKSLFRTVGRWLTTGNRQQKGRSHITKTDEEEEANGLSLLHGIDREAGLKRVMGNEGLFRKIILEFCSDFSGAVQEMEFLIASGKIQKARELAHTVKGTAGNPGAIELQQVAAALERKLAEYDGLPLSDYLERFRTSFEEVLKNRDLLNRPVREAHLRAESPSGNEEENRAKIRALALQLKDQMENSSFGYIATFEALQNLCGDGMHSQLKTCGNHNQEL